MSNNVKTNNDLNTSISFIHDNIKITIDREDDKYAVYTKDIYFEFNTCDEVKQFLNYLKDNL